MRLLFHTPVRPLPGDRYLELDFTHAARRTVLLLLRFHTSARAHPVNDPQAGRLIVAMYPHLRVRPCLDLAYLETARAHHHRQPGVGIICNAGPVIRIADLTAITGLAHRPPAGLRFRLRQLALAREPRPGRVVAPRRPLVDRLGQLIPRRWPGKAASLGPELLPPPPTPVLSAPSFLSFNRSRPGHFTVDRERGRSWIITPAGERLFSLGMDCVTPAAPGPVGGMRHLFRQLPGGTGETASFYTANLIRRYGKAAWRDRWASLATRRLASWGFNTIGNWSDEFAIRERRQYYTINAAWWDEPRAANSWGLYGGFPDVYSASFARRWTIPVAVLTLCWVGGIFFLGFRGFALIPGLVVLALMRHRGYQPRAWVGVSLLVVVLAAIPLARAVRDQRIGERSLARAWSRVQLLDGIVEMGGSLRPLVHTIAYLDHPSWRWGKTYWQSLGTVWPNLARQWEGAQYLALDDLPPNHWLTVQADPDLYRQAGGLGFSAVAEPYMNFGVAGVLAYFFALGALLTRAAELRSIRPLPLAACATVLGPLLWTTRNSFEVFFRPALWGLVMVLAARLGCGLAALRPAARGSAGSPPHPQPAPHYAPVDRQ